MLPIVDIHGHYTASRPDSETDFRRLVDSPEVCRIVVCALALELEETAPGSFMDGSTNEQLAALIAKIDSPKLVPFCYIDPREDDAPKQLEYWISERGMRGVKMYPPQGWYPSEERVLPTFQAAESLGVPVLLHMGRVASHPKLRSKFAEPIHLEDVGLACRDLKLVIGHFGCPWHWQAYRLADGFPNFYFDLTTSGSLDLHLLGIVRDDRYTGVKRILLGTDGDGSNNLSLARATLDRLRTGGFTEEQLEQIAHHNGLALLGEGTDL
ncbi:MAG TPA: amidohydrolase family protein [Planctomycetota bacterium]|nr:amidohydrolase family protein [Planctomycetota bacterium]